MFKTIAFKAAPQMVMASALAGALFLAGEKRAEAITLPDNSSFNCTGTNGCLRITNTNLSRNAITGVASGGNGVEGTTNGGTAAAAVKGTVTAGNGSPAIWGLSRINVSGASAVLAERVDAGGAYVLSGQAVFARGGGVGIVATTTGTGIMGTSESNNNGIVGTSNGNGHGMVGTSLGSGDGVHGVTNAAGSGNAIFGDAGNSGSAWAGNFLGDVNVSGGYYVNGSFVASDARLKTNVKDTPYGLKELLKLRAVTYNMKDQKDTRGRIGVIAQEIQKVLPELVTVNRATGMLAVDYTGIIPVAIRAVQEQETTIEHQAKLIERLDARIAVLEAAKKPVALGSVGASAAALALLPLGFLAMRRRKEREESQSE